MVESPVTQSSLALVSINDGEPPVFKQVLAGTTTIEEGGPLVLDCVITGRPVPQVSFPKNSQNKQNLDLYFLSFIPKTG